MTPDTGSNPNHPELSYFTLDSLRHISIASNLESLTPIAVTGADAQSFLQGQFSNDVAAIAPMQSQLNAYCTPKGRMLALIRLIRHRSGFWLIVPTELGDSVVKRLRLYVMRAQVTIEPDAEITLLGQINADANNGEDAGAGNDIHRIPIAGVIPRNILIGDRKTIDTFVQAKGYNRVYTDNPWRLIDIHSGIPQVYPQTAENFIPQIVNLDLVNGISFSKGCYPGQEIVARLRYLGKVKQRMLAGTVGGVKSLQPGAEIYSDHRADQKVGLVVDAVESGNEEYTFSATVPANLIENGVLLVGSSSGPALTRIALPYPVPTEK